MYKPRDFEGNHPSQYLAAAIANRSLIEVESVEGLCARKTERLRSKGKMTKEREDQFSRLVQHAKAQLEILNITSDSETIINASYVDFNGERQLIRPADKDLISKGW